MLKSKKTTPIEHVKRELRKYEVKNTIHWKELLRVIGIFFVSLFFCFFSATYLFSWLINQPKEIKFSKSQNISKPISHSLVAPFSQVIKAISALNALRYE